MNKEAITFKDAFLATCFHTGIIYGAPLLGFSRVDIAAILGNRLIAGGPNRKAVGGLLIHFALGTIIFPVCFNTAARPFLPGNHRAASLSYAVLLWLMGQHAAIPMLGRGRLFEERPDATLTYFLAHLAYGIVCGKTGSRRL